MKIFRALALLIGCQSPISIDLEPFNVPLPSSVEEKPSSTDMEVYFSPNGGVTDAIVREIQNSQIIYVQAYSFTSPVLGNVLIEAHNANKRVYLILDKSDVTGRGSLYNAFKINKLNICIDDKHAIAHNKVMILDNKKVLTGSFNFTVAAEKSNAENSLHILNVDLAKRYMDNWQNHKQHSKCNF